MESDTGQSMVNVEKAFEDSKANRLTSRHKWEAAKGRYHMELIARREAGENITVTDMKAMEATAIDSIDYVKEAYLNFIQADAAYRSAKVSWENAKRNYWDKKLPR